MKKVTFICLLFLSVSCAETKIEMQNAEVSCGQCQFGLTSQDGCNLAVRLDDKAYFVDGADIDDFGDAHDKETGFCEVIRLAKVSGEIVNDRFQLRAIELSQ